MSQPIVDDGGSASSSGGLVGLDPLVEEGASLGMVEQVRPAPLCRLRAPASFFVAAPSGHGDGWILGHAMTGEAVALPALVGDDGWEFDEDGVQAYVSDEAQSRWCQEMFEWAAYAPDDAETIDMLLVSCITGAKINLAEWHRQYTSCSLTLQHAHGQSAEIQCYKFKNKQDGSMLWLSLSSLYEGFGFTAKGASAQRWYNHQWPTWRRHLVEAQLDPDVALRKALAIGDSADHDLHRRCLERATISIHGLLALLMRWCFFPPRRGGLLQDLAHACALLQALCGLLKGRWQAQVFLDERCARRPPAGVCGKAPILLRFVGGEVDLSAFLAPLRVAQRGRLHDMLKEAAGVGRVSVSELMEGLCAEGCKLSISLAQQLVWLVADRLDRQFADGLEEPGAGSRLKPHRRFLPTIDGRKRMVVAYALASQQEFGDEDLQYCSAAFDMSSVGGRRTGCGVVANAKNVAMLTAPQPPPAVCVHPFLEEVGSGIGVGRPTHFFRLVNDSFAFSKQSLFRLVNTCGGAC